MQKFILVIISVLIFVFMAWGTLYFHSLGKVYETKNNPFYKNTFEVIAHRGGSQEAPENTLKAFDHATAINPDVIIEYDVHVTADKKVVVFHDTLLERTTNGAGPIQAQTLDELKKLDAAYHFKNTNNEYPLRNQGIQIPTLEEVLEKYPQTRMIIEIKPNSIDAAVLVMSILEKYQRLDKTLLGSEHSPIIKYIKSKNINLFTTAGKDEILRSVMLENMFLERLDPMNADTYCIPERHEGIQILTPRLLTELHRRSKKAFIWTVNTEAEMNHLIQMGVDGIISDRPEFLFQLTQNRK